jgi:CMP-N,N'-diacetyllegionaminic acid synthase
MNKLLGLIPARNGSKGLLNKNIKPLNGKPLISHTIDAAIQSKVIDRLIVSTDGSEIAAISNKYGAETPFIRPGHLSTDNADILDVVEHTLNHIEKTDGVYEYVLLLQPTSPLRTHTDIINTLEIIENQNDSVIGVMESPHHPDTYFRLHENNLIRKSDIDSIAHVNRQDLKSHYKINGAIYCFKWALFKKYRTWFFEKTKAYIMPNVNSIDIDTILDFKLAELIMKERLLN